MNSYTLPLLLVLTISAGFSVENPGALSERLLAKHTADMTAAALRWFKSADLADVAVPNVGPDPTESARKAEREAQELNGLIGLLRQWRDRAGKGDKEGEQAAYEWFSGITASNPQVALYIKHKGKSR